MTTIKDQDALKNLIRIVSQGKATKEQAKVLKEVMSATDNKKMDVFRRARDQGRLALDYDGVPLALPKKRKATASVKEEPVVEEPVVEEPSEPIAKSKKDSKASKAEKAALAKLSGEKSTDLVEASGTEVEEPKVEKPKATTRRRSSKAQEASVVPEKSVTPSTSSSKPTKGSPVSIDDFFTLQEQGKLPPMLQGFADRLKNEKDPAIRQRIFDAVKEDGKFDKLKPPTEPKLEAKPAAPAAPTPAAPTAAPAAAPVAPAAASPDLGKKSLQELADIINKPILPTTEEPAAKPRAPKAEAKPTVVPEVEAPKIAAPAPVPASALSTAVKEAAERVPEVKVEEPSLFKDTPEIADKQAKAVQKGMAAPEPTLTASNRTTMNPEFEYQLTPEGTPYKTGSEAPKPPVKTSSSPKYRIDPTGELIAESDSILGPKTSKFIQEALGEGKAPRATGGSFDLGPQPSGGFSSSLSTTPSSSGLDLSPTSLAETAAEAATKAPSRLQSALGAAKRVAPGLLKGAGYLAAARDVYDVGSHIKNEEYDEAARSAASALGGWGGAEAGGMTGAALGAPFGPPGALAGGIAGGLIGGFGGSYLGGKGADLLQDWANEGPEKAKQQNPIRQLEALIATAKTDKEREDLAATLARTRVANAGGSEKDQLIAGNNERKRLDYTRPEAVRAADERISNRDAQLTDFIANAETSGRKDQYTVVNEIGATGKYQLLPKWHAKEIEKRYNIPFSEIVNHPEIQEHYFSNVLLPQYKKDAAELVKTPQAQQQGLDEFTLTGMLQLGPQNVKNYLQGKADPNISKQMEYFKKKANEYKKEQLAESEDIQGLKQKEQEWQEQGKYIPYKSAQAKMDTLRSGELSMQSNDIDKYNLDSDMVKDAITKSVGESGSYIPYASPEAMVATMREQQAERKPASVAPAAAEIPTEEKPGSEKSVPQQSPTQTERPRSRLEEALELQRQYEMLAGISRGSERLGRGLAGAISGVAPSKMSGGEFEEGLTRMGKQGVEGAKLLNEEQKEKDSADPSSDVSKKARNAYKKAYAALGVDIDVPDTLSADDMKITKFSDLAKASDKEKTGLEKANTKRIDTLGKSLIAELQSRPQFGIDAKTLANVQNADALLQGYKTLDDIPQAQVYEVARAVDRIVSQASPTISASKELTPATAYSVLKKYLSYASGQVTGAGVGEFLKNYQKLLHREKVQAQARVKNVQNRIAAPYLDLWENPDYKDRIRFIFKSNGLDADSIFNTTGSSTEGREATQQQSTDKIAPSSEEKPKHFTDKKREPGKIIRVDGVLWRIGENGYDATRVE